MILAFSLEILCVLRVLMIRWSDTSRDDQWLSFLWNWGLLIFATIASFLLIIIYSLLCLDELCTFFERPRGVVPTLVLVRGRDTTHEELALHAENQCWNNPRHLLTSCHVDTYFIHLVCNRGLLFVPYVLCVANYYSIKKLIHAHCSRGSGYLASCRTNVAKISILYRMMCVWVVFFFFTRHVQQCRSSTIDPSQRIPSRRRLALEKQKQRMQSMKGRRTQRATMMTKRQRRLWHTVVRCRPV